MGQDIVIKVKALLTPTFWMLLPLVNTVGISWQLWYLIIMNATEVLKYEHRNIERLIEVLKIATKELQEGNDVDPQTFIKSGSFITQYMEQKHHAKEEKIFFELLEKYGFSKNENPLKDLLREHNEAREHTQALRHAGYQLEQGEETARPVLLQRAHSYIRLLTHHIKHEDDELFPLADRTLSEKSQQELNQRFEEYDENFPEEPLLKKLTDLEAMVQ